jgi:phytanoyl-CoA hydroxylase
MIKLKTPHGLSVNVPEIKSEDPSPKFSIEDIEIIKDYYFENGYVIIKNLFAKQQCKEVMKLWDEEIKKFNGYIYRQTTGKPQRHIKNNNGWIMNPILNLQSMNPKNFSKFRKFVTEDLICNIRLSNVFSSILNDDPKIVQSMYFEGNSATPEHQDSYYLDSEESGEMVAAWIALETISAEAGRFFICPKSHKIKLDDPSLYNKISENHEVYIQSVVKKIKDESLKIRAPVLNQGDVLFWNSLTIHGSLDSSDLNNSRSSITCHAIPNKKKLIELQALSLDLITQKIYQTYIFKPKDLSLFKNRFIFHIESRFPNLYSYLRKQLK